MKKLLAILCAVASVAGALWFALQMLARFCRPSEDGGMCIPLEGTGEEEEAGPDAGAAEDGAKE